MVEQSPHHIPAHQMGVHPHQYHQQHTHSIHPSPSSSRSPDVSVPSAGPRVVYAQNAAPHSFQRPSASPSATSPSAASSMSAPSSTASSVTHGIATSASSSRSVPPFVSPQSHSSHSDQSNVGFRAWIRDHLIDGMTGNGVFIDIVLITFILASIVTVVLEMIPAAQQTHGETLLMLEWFFTIVFTIEYILRISCSKDPLKYVVSFSGIIDFLSTIPQYLAAYFVFAEMLTLLRVLRLVRASTRFLRMIKNVDHLASSIFGIHAHLLVHETLLAVFRSSRRAFLMTYVCIIVLFMGAILQLAQLELAAASDPSHMSENPQITIALCIILILVSILLLVRLELRIWATRYGLTNMRVIKSIGLISEHTVSVSISKIIDVELRQTFTGKLLGIGSISIHTASDVGPGLPLLDIQSPHKIKQMIQESIEASPRS